MLKEGKYYVCIGKPKNLDEIANYYNYCANMYGFNIDFKQTHFSFVPNAIYGPMSKDNFFYDSNSNRVYIEEKYEMYFKEIDVVFDNEAMRDIAHLNKGNKYLEINIMIKPSYVSENKVLFDVFCNLIIKKDYGMLHFRNINSDLKDSISRIKKVIRVELLRRSKVYKAINGKLYKKR